MTDDEERLVGVVADRVVTDVVSLMAVTELELPVVTDDDVAEVVVAVVTLIADNSQLLTSVPEELPAGLKESVATPNVPVSDARA